MLVMERIGMKNRWYMKLVMKKMVMLGKGMRFLKKGVKKIMRGKKEMKQMVVVGKFEEWGFQVVEKLMKGEMKEGKVKVYLEEEEMIVKMIMIGRYMEEREKGRKSDEIRSIVGLKEK